MHVLIVYESTNDAYRVFGPFDAEEDARGYANARNLFDETYYVRELEQVNYPR